MAKLLYLEDNGYLLKQTVRFLNEDGYKVEAIKRIDQAIEKFPKISDKIDCIITDLNMEDEWLGEYRNESEGGLLSGWVWLRRYVYANEKCHIPCIIYSGYIPELKEYLIERKELDLLKEYPVSCVRKGGNDDNGYSALIQKLEEITSP